jgi:hypothetical protein
MKINYKNTTLNFELKTNSLPKTHDIYVDFDDKISIIKIDTRDNTIFFNDKKYSKSTTAYNINEYEKDIINAIFYDFEEFKKTDFRYGNIKNGDRPGYSPSKNIEIVDFLNYLKSRNREELIDKII